MRDRDPVRIEQQRDLVRLSSLSHGILWTGIFFCACCVPVFLIGALPNTGRAASDLMTLAQSFALPLLLVGLPLAALGLVGDMVLNMAHWRERREDDQERLADLSGRTRFGWGKKRHKLVRSTKGRPRPARPPCVLPPPRVR